MRLALLYVLLKECGQHLLIVISLLVFLVGE